MTKGKSSTSPSAKGGYNTRSKRRKVDSQTNDSVDGSSSDVSNMSRDAAATGDNEADVMSTNSGTLEVSDNGASHAAQQEADDGASGGINESSSEGIHHGASRGDQQAVRHPSQHIPHGHQDETSEETLDGVKNGLNPGARKGKQQESREWIDKGSESWLWSVLMMVAVLIVLIAVIVATVLFTPQSTKTNLSQSATKPEVELPEQTQEDTMLDEFQDKLLQLMAKFPKQHHRLWRMLSAVTKRIIKDKRPIQPGVVLLGSTLDTRREVECIVRHFSHIVTELFESKPPVAIDVKGEYSHLTPGDAKVAMETSLWEGFGAGSQSAVISGIEDMYGNMAMLLHAFCDNDNAPFTKVVILLTLHTDLQKLGVKDDAKVEDYLSRIWQRHMDIDNVSALLTRVANNVVIPRKESEAVLTKYC